MEANKRTQQPNEDRCQKDPHPRVNVTENMPHSIVIPGPNTVLQRKQLVAGEKDFLPVCFSTSRNQKSEHNGRQTAFVRLLAKNNSLRKPALPR